MSRLRALPARVRRDGPYRGATPWMTTPNLRFLAVSRRRFLALAGIGRRAAGLGRRGAVRRRPPRHPERRGLPRRRHEEVPGLQHLHDGVRARARGHARPTTCRASRSSRTPWATGPTTCSWRTCRQCENAPVRRGLPGRARQGQQAEPRVRQRADDRPGALHRLPELPRRPAPSRRSGSSGTPRRACRRSATSARTRRSSARRAGPAASRPACASAR